MHMSVLALRKPIVVLGRSKPIAQQSKRLRAEKKTDTVSQTQGIARQLQVMADTAVHACRFRWLKCRRV
jgi:hypothetical protein